VYKLRVPRCLNKLSSLLIHFLFVKSRKTFLGSNSLSYIDIYWFIIMRKSRYLIRNWLKFFTGESLRLSLNIYLNIKLTFLIQFHTLSYPWNLSSKLHMRFFYLQNYPKFPKVPIWPWNSTVHNRPWTSIQDLFHPNTWQTPVAADIVYGAPDDGRKGRPKHAEHTCSC